MLAPIPSLASMSWWAGCSSSPFSCKSCCARQARAQRWHLLRSSASVRASALAQALHCLSVPTCWSLSPFMGSAPVQKPACRKEHVGHRSVLCGVGSGALRAVLPYPGRSPLSKLSDMVVESLNTMPERDGLLSAAYSYGLLGLPEEIAEVRGYSGSSGRSHLLPRGAG